MAVSLKVCITAPVFWHLRFQCIISASQFSGVCRFKMLNRSVLLSLRGVCSIRIYHYKCAKKLCDISQINCCSFTRKKIKLIYYCSLHAKLCHLLELYIIDQQTPCPNSLAYLKPIALLE